MNKKQQNNEYIYTNLDKLVAIKYDIRGFHFLPKQPVQSQLTGKHRSRLRGRGLDFEEVRNYNFGDDIRNIDWKVTARTKKPHTKVFTEERERPVFLVVDQSVSMFFGSQKYMKSVVAAEGAALAAWKVLAVGDRIGGIVFNDKTFDEVKPKRNSKAVLRFLSMIVEKNNQLNANSYVDQNPEMLNKILEQTLKYITHNYLIVIYSDFYGYNDKTIKVLKQISRHNDVIAAIITDPYETDLKTDMIIGEGESQINLAEIDTKKKEQFTNIMSKRIKHLKDTLFRYNITTLQFNTFESNLVQLRRMLGGRK
jgi:uncharacterized protein (DUF58 family)